jgi:hypothetical protein
MTNGARIAATSTRFLWQFAEFAGGVEVSFQAATKVGDTPRKYQTAGYKASLKDNSRPST